jgi:hypothetical protein
VLTAAAAALGRIDEVQGNKAFDTDAIRGTCLDVHDAMPVIPNKLIRTDPWPWDKVMPQAYKDRNRIERAFGKAKQFRRFATRDEKLKEIYLGLVRLLFGFMQFRTTARTVNTTQARSLLRLPAR